MSDFIKHAYRTATGRCATLTVAANDSSALSKQQADYVCDGTADQVEIQAAIDALPSAGGKVLLLDGTFNMADSVGPYGSIYITRNNVVLEGMGDCTILKRAATLTHVSIIRFATDSVGQNNLVFRNFMIDCDNGYIYGIRSGTKYNTNILIENVHIKDSSTGSTSRQGIIIGGRTGYMGQDFKLINCILENTGGITISGVDGVLIDGCTVRDTAWFNLTAQRGCIRTATCANITITNNVVDTCTDGGVNGAFANGIDIGSSAESFIVAGNTVIDVISHSINLQHGTGVGVISNNIIRNTLYECICVEYDNPQYITIENNICDNADRYGIWVSGNTDATVDPAEIADYINITGNVVYDCTYGIKMQHVDHSRLSGNIIYNIAAGAGVMMSACQYCDITNNHIQKTCQDGGTSDDASIYLLRAGSAPTCHECENNTIIANHIVEDGANKPTVVIKEQAVAEVLNNIIRQNIVHGISNQETENSGTATLANGTTSIAVNHGLRATPTVGDIVVTPIEAWGNMTQFYIDTYTSTQFTIRANINPGQDVDFAWKAIVL